MLGIDGLPPSWLAVLELRDVIDRVASDLHTSLILGRRLRSYPPS